MPRGLTRVFPKRRTKRLSLDLEMEAHIFAHGHKAKDTWPGVFKWWDLRNTHFSSLEDMIAYAYRTSMLTLYSHFFDAVMQSTIWTL
ncbi:hypothetical protein Tco_0777554 [Tanacetum coccineum]